jgi:hypothetical protein
MERPNRTNRRYYNNGSRILINLMTKKFNVNNNNRENKYLYLRSPSTDKNKNFNVYLQKILIHGKNSSNNSPTNI